MRLCNSARPAAQPAFRLLISQCKTCTGAPASARHAGRLAARRQRQAGAATGGPPTSGAARKPSLPSKALADRSGNPQTGEQPLALSSDTARDVNSLRAAPAGPSDLYKDAASHSPLAPAPLAKLLQHAQASQLGARPELVWACLWSADAASHGHESLAGSRRKCPAEHAGRVSGLQRQAGDTFEAAARAAARAWQPHAHARLWAASQGTLLQHQMNPSSDGGLQAQLLPGLVSRLVLLVTAASQQGQGMAATL